MVGGLYVAAITPRRASGHELDLGAALEVIDYLCSHRINGIALLGSTGEFVHFDLDERARFTALAAKRSRAPVIANVSHSTLDGAVGLAQEAASCGAAGLLLMPPYFFRYSQQEVRQFYLNFARELNSSAPIYLYNVPQFTNEIACDTALDLLSTGLFAGMKDSSGSFEYLERLIAPAREKRFAALVGNDVVYVRGRQAGAHGVVSGVACSVPELMIGLERAIAAADQARVERLGLRLTEFLDWLDRFPAPLGVKLACAARKVKVGPPAAPLSPDAEHAAGEFSEWFHGWLPEVRKEACV